MATTTKRTAPSARTTRAPSTRTAKRAGKPARTAAARTPAKRVTPELTGRATVDEMVVQADLASMEARDQWNRLMSEVDRRRMAVETAVRRLASGGAEASRTMNEAVREAMTELRDALDGALAALR